MRGMLPFPAATHKRELQRVGQDCFGVVLMQAPSIFPTVVSSKPIRVALAESMVLVIHVTNMLWRTSLGV
jgi:hypothetical protein